MKLAASLILFVCALTASSAAHALEGHWFGKVDSDRGTMQIGLETQEADGNIRGVVKTAHGDWPITSISEDNGTFTVVFDNGDRTGKLIGRVEGNHFTGTWDNSPYATGTFELTKR